MESILNGLLLVVFISASWAGNSDVGKFIGDFRQYYQYPERVLAFSCWGKDFEKSFDKQLQDNCLYSKLHLRDVNNVTFDQSVVFVDLSCDQSEELLRKAELQNLFTPTQHWLLYNSTFNLHSFFFPPASDVCIVEPTYHGFSVRTIYKSSSNSLLYEKLIGKWSQGYNELYSKIDERKLRNLRKEVVKVSYVVEDVDTIKHLDSYQYRILNDTMTKMNYAMIQSLMDVINATKIDVFRTHMEKGMIDDLKSGECDIGGTPVALLPYRLTELSVLGKTAGLENKFIFRATPHSYISNVFTLPFDSYVWYSCFGLMAVIFIAAYLTVYWEWRDPVFTRFLSERLNLKPKASDIILMEIGSVAQQGFESEPGSTSGRLVFILTLISMLFLYTSFSASIVALLQSTTESLNSLDNLFESRIPVGFKDNISMDYFEDLKSLNKSKEFYAKIRKPLFLSIEQGIRMVQEDFFAFYGDTAEIYKYVKDLFREDEKCSLREIPFKNTHVDHWLFMKKRSTHGDMFKAGIHRMHETGIRNREYHRFFTQKPICESAGGNFESVGLADSYGAFMVMGIGMFFSIMLVTSENLWVKYHRMKTITQQQTLFTRQSPAE